MNSYEEISRWDEAFFKKFTINENEYVTLKTALTITTSFHAFLLLDDTSNIVSRFIISKTNRPELFIGYYINKSNNNFLLRCETQIKRFSEAQNIKEIVGPIDINIFNQYRYTQEISTIINKDDNVETDNINDFLMFGFDIAHKWYLISFPKLIGFIWFTIDTFKSLHSSIQLETRNSASLDDIYNIAIETYKHMPYFEDPGLDLFKECNKDLLKYYNEDERIFYYKDNRLVAFCLFKKEIIDGKTRVIFSHLGRRAIRETKGLSRHIHLTLCKREKFMNLLYPPFFDLIHEKSSIFYYFPMKYFSIHKKYITLSFSF